MRNSSQTEADILRIASRTEYRVSKYAWSQEQLRKLTRRMGKDGKLVLMGFDGTHFCYRTSASQGAQTKKEHHDIDPST